jgi:hypothetical protein
MAGEQEHHHTFKLTGEDSQGFEYLEMRVNANANIDTMIRTFECYLKASGFNFKGQIELVED